MNGDKNQQCEKNEQLITWNVVGPKGDKGDTEATGPQGPSNAFFRLPVS
jgi:hypothetical protein